MIEYLLESKSEKGQMMRRFLIDTDTASDDAVALIMALREESVKVEAITVVAGNIPIDLAVKNALISVEFADTYAPPVYKGMGKPLLRDLFTAENVHGEDGLGDVGWPDPQLTAADGHGVDKIIETVHQFPNELEIITLGPLTNLAMACLKEPTIAQLVKHVYVMGGAGFGHGNITPVAEFNIFVDAEAAHIVTTSGLPITFVGWDVSTDDTFVTTEELDQLLATGSKIADFCVRCNTTLKQYNHESWGKEGIDLPDPTAVAAALFPEIITKQLDAFVAIEHHAPATYGQLIIDANNLLGQKANATICYEIDAARFKELLFKLVV